jgi:hypothetical protein
MAKFEFNDLNIYEQATELLKAFQVLSQTGKKYGIRLHATTGEKISEKTVLQVVGAPSYYSGILKHFIAGNKGMVEYNASTGMDNSRVKVLTLEER